MHGHYDTILKRSGSRIVRIMNLHDAASSPRLELSASQAGQRVDELCVESSAANPSPVRTLPCILALQ